MKKYLYIVGVVLSFFLCSCNSNVLYDRSEKIDKDGWKMNDKKNFKVEVSDLDRTSLYRFAINISNTGDYKYNNIYFFVTTVYPDGKISVRDTVECELTYPDGEWKGHSLGGDADNRFWFAHNVDFKQKGVYTFRIEQATGDTLLLGVKTVGLHIEKMPENK